MNLFLVLSTYVYGALFAAQIDEVKACRIRTGKAIYDLNLAEVALRAERRAQLRRFESLRQAYEGAVRFQGFAKTIRSTAGKEELENMARSHEQVQDLLKNKKFAVANAVRQEMLRKYTPFIKRLRDRTKSSFRIIIGYNGEITIKSNDDKYQIQIKMERDSEGKQISIAKVRIQDERMFDRRFIVRYDSELSDSQSVYSTRIKYDSKSADDYENYDYVHGVKSVETYSLERLEVSVARAKSDVKDCRQAYAQYISGRSDKFLVDQYLKSVDKSVEGASQSAKE